MIASRDFRRMGTTREITLTMSLTEFREAVEWIEGMAPHDGYTKDLRAELDRIEPVKTLADVPTDDLVAAVNRESMDLATPLRPLTGSTEIEDFGTFDLQDIQAELRRRGGA